MKKIIAILLALIMCVSLFAACSSEPAPTTQPTETTPIPAWNSGPEALQSKKIIFIGNSYTFWGQTVILKGTGVLGQQERSDDQGYFYQLCKANGLDVSVTNWTFGGHDISDLFDGPCNKGDDKCSGETHEYYLQDISTMYASSPTKRATMPVTLLSV
jgi:hypothetical protein